jgi:mannose-6-phosphate isomerase-like protein (cupin superfamily)
VESPRGVVGCVRGIRVFHDQINPTQRADLFVEHVYIRRGANRWIIGPANSVITKRAQNMFTTPRKLLVWTGAITIAIFIAIFGNAAPPDRPVGVGPTQAQEKLPDSNFTHPPEKPHDPGASYFNFDQLEYYYRVPGEFTHRLTGDQYGFEGLSFIISKTYPGGGPGLHVHDAEEAHVLLEGSIQYRIGDTTFTVQAPYVAKVPKGVPHTFMNIGTKPFNLIAVFASKHPGTKRIGPNPLVRLAPKK